MIKFILKVLKKIIFSCFLLYGYNIIVQPLGLLIPINYFTILLISIFGVPSLMCLIFIMILVY